MTAGEFARWIAYYQEAPFGDDVDGLRLALLSANICAALTGKGQRVVDHLLKFGNQSQTPQQQIMILEAVRAMSGKTSQAKQKAS